MSVSTHAFEKKWRNHRDHFRIMWGLRFTLQHPWRFKSFGMSNYITWEIVTGILEICAASFFRVWKSSKCSWNMQAAHFSEMVVIPLWTWYDIPGDLNLPFTTTLCCYMKGISHQQYTIKLWFQLKKKKNRISKILNLTEQNKEPKPLW